MKESQMFPYIARAYPGVPEDWRWIMRLVEYDKELNIRSVHYFDMNCFVSSLGRLMKDGGIGKPGTVWISSNASDGTITVFITSDGQRKIFSLITGIM